MPRPGCGTARPRHRVEVGLIEAACIRGHTLWSVLNVHVLRFEGCASPLCRNRWSCRIFWVRRAIACLERRDTLRLILLTRSGHRNPCNGYNRHGVCTGDASCMAAATTQRTLAALFGTGNLQNVAGKRGERGPIQWASHPRPVDWWPQECLRGCLCHSPAPRSRLCCKARDATLVRVATLSMRDANT